MSEVPLYKSETAPEGERERLSCGGAHRRIEIDPLLSPTGPPCIHPTEVVSAHELQCTGVPRSYKKQNAHSLGLNVPQGPRHRPSRRKERFLMSKNVLARPGTRPGEGTKGSLL